MSALSSPRRFWVAGTSKKPPQMRQFPGGGRDFRFNRFEHGGENITEADTNDTNFHELKLAGRDVLIAP